MSKPVDNKYDFPPMVIHRPLKEPSHPEVEVPKESTEKELDPKSPKSPNIGQIEEEIYSGHDTARTAANRKFARDFNDKYNSSIIISDRNDEYVGGIMIVRDEAGDRVEVEGKVPISQVQYELEKKGFEINGAPRTSGERTIYDIFKPPMKTVILPVAYQKGKLILNPDQADAAVAKLNILIQQGAIKINGDADAFLKEVKEELKGSKSAAVSLEELAEIIGVKAEIKPKLITRNLGTTPAKNEDPFVRTMDIKKYNKVMAEAYPLLDVYRKGSLADGAATELPKPPKINTTK